MKLIIDIPEYNFERIKEYYDALPEDGIVEAIVYYIANGTPLDKIRAEIADAFIKHGLGNTKICFDILQIIDRKGEQHDR